ncbi:MAG: dihydroxyacetone kinase phosphoryl donor subunit DhaM [Actinomycetaceae bacterium]|nr:dihydroxyacetone kinase phosphoryl donor subunit DhaM [Actinomycetaceae bacterium]
MAKVSLVIVSHSAQLAAGVAEVAAQMAPDVTITPAGGTADGDIGTSYDLVDEAVGELVEAGEVVLLTDLGSATLTVESVLEFRDDEPVYFADGPLVEGAVAAAVAAQQGKSAEDVVAAVTQAGAQFTPSSSKGSHESSQGGSSTVEATVEIGDPDGLHARPAALVARLVADFDADVTINEVAADSVLSLMALSVRQGDTVTVAATGPDAEQALSTLVKKLGDGFQAS